MLPTGDGVDLGILLPPNVNPTTFYKYGPTTDDPTPHWYDFSFDATTGTGAQLLGTVTVTSPVSGVVEEKNFIIVRYIDGAKGDDDLEANGIVINSQSGISFSQPATDSGSFSALSLLIIFIFNIWRCRFFQQVIKQKLNR